MGGNRHHIRIQKGIKMSAPKYKVQVLDALTGEEYERDMSPEEIAAIPEERNVVAD